MKDDGQKADLQLHLAGYTVQKVLKGLAPGGKKFADISKALNDHFLPMKNVRYERFIFKQTVQKKVNQSIILRLD